MQPDVAEVEVADSLDLAMQSYRRYLDETPTSAMTPEAMRRLADLQLEKEFGITGGDAPSGRWIEMAAPDAGEAPSRIGAGAAPTIADAVAAAARIRRGLRAPYDRRARVPAGRRVRRRRVRTWRRALGPARSDRDLRAAARRVSELRAPRSGALSDGARLRRARPHRGGDGRHAAPRRRVRLLAL